MTFAPRCPPFSLMQVTVDKHFYKQGYCAYRPLRTSGCVQRDRRVHPTYTRMLYACTCCVVWAKLASPPPSRLILRSSFTSILYILLLLLLFLVLSVFFSLFLHPAPYGSFSLSFREELAYNIHKKVFEYLVV